jgi:hypothetical protein
MIRYPLLFAAFLAGAVGCRSSTAPDPESFGPMEDETKVDPRQIVFYNGSVEMAQVEIFAPVAKISDCMAEAPHRLLCPTDYRHVYNEKVYPRTKAQAQYPKELPLECAQVWVRVHTKAMQPNEYRQAIFLLPGEETALVLELGDGEAARLAQRGISDKNRFPAPKRYCDPDSPELTEAPRENIRPAAQVTKIVAGAKSALQTCSRETPRRGLFQATLSLRCDGTVLASQVKGARRRADAKADELHGCLLKALAQLRFPGFTPSQTSADVSLRLPIR